MAFKLPPKPGEFRPMDFLTEHDCLNQPDPKYLIDGHIPEAATGLMIGGWGTLKTFLALDISLTMTHGTGNFHGHPTQAGAVVYIAGEGAGGIGKRIAAWRTYQRITHAQQSPFYLIRRNIDMLDDDQIERLLATLKWIEKEHNCVFKMGWLDTVSRALNGKPENEESLSLMVNNATRVREEMGNGMSFGLIHHKGKDATKGARGSSVAESNADFVIDLTRDKDKSPDEMTLTISKLKDDEDGMSFPYVTRVVPWVKDGVTHSSLVLVAKDEETAEDAQARRDRQHDNKDAKQELDMLTRIANLPLGNSYTLGRVCELIGIARGSSKYNRLRQSLPDRKSRFIAIAPGQLRCLMRTIDASGENVQITAVGPDKTSE